METNQDLFEIFRNTLCHGFDWPKTARAVVAKSVLTSNPTPFSNSSEHHVETETISFLNQQLQTAVNNKTLQRGSVITQTIYINYTPCSEPGHGCSYKIRTFVYEVKQRYDLQLQLCLICAGLYNINRQSCAAAGCFSGSSVFPHRRVDDSISNSNSQGLKHLLQAGVKLKTFDAADWNELSLILEAGDCGPRFYSGIDEDENMKNDLQWILTH